MILEGQLLKILLSDHEIREHDLAAESSLFISRTSLLKIRSDLPRDLAESGRRFDPKRITKTTANTSKCHGLSEFMLKSYPI